MHRVLLGSLCLLALVTSVDANGRPPATSTINFRRGMESTIYAGMSFGLLISKDNGASWSWMCEDALPYGGMYDPDYELMDSGTVFATTFDGLKVNRDGCVFENTALAPPAPDLKFFSVLARASDNTLYVAAADPTDGKIYRSTDEGMTFPQSSTAGQLNDWYSSLEVAPSDPTRLYLSGYRFVQTSGGTKKEFLLFTSTNSGASWSPLPVTDFTAMSNSTIEIVGVGKTDPNTVYARVTLEDNAIGDGIYKTTNAGASWTRIIGKQGAISFLARANGELLAGTQTLGLFKSTNGGTTWTEVAGAPHVNCLSENSAGEVWACTQNYGIPQVPMDGFGIMKSTDLATWTGVLKYQDIKGPVACPTNTAQYMKCDRGVNQNAGWCGLCAQLGCDPKRDCANGFDAPPDGGGGGGGGGGGCCETSDGGAPGLLALGTAIGIVLLRRRRTRK